MSVERYTLVYEPTHPRATVSGCIRAHVLVAERALGHLLPASAEVHHVNGNRRDDSNRNLVICQDRGYHMLLHRRTRVVRAGGNPNTERLCAHCQVVRDVSCFPQDRWSCCRLCVIRAWRLYKEKNRDRINARRRQQRVDARLCG